jgi:hypothetical protein
MGRGPSASYRTDARHIVRNTTASADGPEELTDGEIGFGTSPCSNKYEWDVRLPLKLEVAFVNVSSCATSLRDTLEVPDGFRIRSITTAGRLKLHYSLRLYVSAESTLGTAFAL